MVLGYLIAPNISPWGRSLSAVFHLRKVPPLHRRPPGPAKEQQPAAPFALISGPFLRRGARPIGTGSNLLLCLSVPWNNKCGLWWLPSWTAPPLLALFAQGGLRSAFWHSRPLYVSCPVFFFLETTFHRGKTGNREFLFSSKHARPCPYLWRCCEVNLNLGGRKVSNQVFFTKKPGDLFTKPRPKGRSLFFVYFPECIGHEKKLNSSLNLKTRILTAAGGPQAHMPF